MSGSNPFSRFSSSYKNNTIRALNFAEKLEAANDEHSSPELVNALAVWGTYKLEKCNFEQRVGYDNLLFALIDNQNISPDSLAYIEKIIHHLAL